MRTPRAPAGLGSRARRFWRDIHAGYAFDDDVSERPALELLVEAVRALDLCERYQTILDAEGPMSVGSAGQPVVHPASAALARHRAQLAQLLRRLDLPGPDEARPTGPVMPFSQHRRAAQRRWAQAKKRRGRNASA
jgi:hypothetical protein